MNIKAGQYMTHHTGKIYQIGGFISKGLREITNLSTGHWTTGSTENLLPYFLQPGDWVVLANRGSLKMTDIFIDDQGKSLYVRFIKPLSGEELLLTFEEVEKEFLRLDEELWRD